MRLNYLIKIRMILTVAAILMLIAMVFFGLKSDHNPDKLWQIISQQCLADMQEHHNPAPCHSVDIAKGYVLFKDNVGALQYLLMPTSKINGIESPILQYSDTPNYFAAAWSERDILSLKRGSAVQDQQIALAINSVSGRSQNQLHIHISCIRSDVAKQLSQISPRINGQWQTLSLHGHDYRIRALSLQQLEKQSVFIRIADEIPEASSNMGHYGVALTSLPDGRLVLMVVERNLLKGNQASAEELQDHQCQILNQAATTQKLALSQVQSH